MKSLLWCYWYLHLTQVRLLPCDWLILLSWLHISCWFSKNTHLSGPLCHWQFLSDPSPIISLHCHSVSKSWFWILLILLALFELFPWICQNWYMDFSKLSQGFVKIDTYGFISLSCYTDLSKLFYIFFALCKTKPSRSLTKISKLESFKASALN